MSDTKQAIAALNLELVRREQQADYSFCTEEDWVLGFLEGKKSADYQVQLFGELLENLIGIATQRGERHSASYARYLLKRIGYVDKKRTK